MLAVTRTWLPLSENGCDIAADSRSGSPSRPSAPSIRIANSSPPSRATVSALRAQARNRSAAAMSSRSPSAWPRLSFTVLKSSRSRNSTVTGVPAALRQRQRVAHPVAEQRAVGEPGERIVERLVDELLLQPAPLAHVAGVEHDALDRRVVQQVRRQDLGVEPRAVGLAEAPLDRARSRRAPARRRGRRSAARSRSSGWSRSVSVCRIIAAGS